MNDAVHELLQEIQAYRQKVRLPEKAKMYDELIRQCEAMLETTPGNLCTEDGTPVTEVDYVPTRTRSIRAEFEALRQQTP